MRIDLFCVPALLVEATLLLAGCAGQVPPPGGPLDTVPPRVIRTFPDSNAVRVSTKHVELEFSEYVDRRSVEESIFISPFVGELEFDWSGREVSVSFSEPLKPGRTYVVNVGTDVIDVHARNRMASGFTLAFSTGDSIDRGYISGRVYDDRPEGVMIFAYAMEGIRADTLNPAHTRPDYIMQTGRGGKFILSNIALGPYRLFAVRDEYRNFLYDREIDQIGMAQGDLVLAPGRASVEGVNFLLTKEDTSRIFVISATAVNRRQIDLRFSEPPDSSRFSEARFDIRDTLSGREVPVAASFLRRAPVWTAGLVTGGPLDSARGYRISVRGVVDRADNLLDSSRAVTVFEGTSRPDSLRTVVTAVGLKDSVKGIFPARSFEIEFSEPVRRSPMTAAIMLKDSTGRGVKATMAWDDEVHARLVPAASLASRAWYVLTLVLDSLQNYRGTVYHDSVLVIHFQTLDLRTTGTMEGAVVDADAPRAGHGYVITARSTNLTPVHERTLEIAAPGKFTLDRLIEGNYAVFGFDNRDSTGRYSYGSPFPYVPSARFAAYPDTVRVRARWAVEGVVLQFGR
jgi:Bacterial Ig-like domain